MPVIKKPAGSKDVFGDNVLTRLFPGGFDPADMVMPMAGTALEAGPLASLLERLKSMLGLEAKAPTNVGDALLRNHELDSRISGMEPPARTGLPGKGADQLEEDAYNRIMQNGMKRTTPELRKPK